MEMTITIAFDAWRSNLHGGHVHFYDFVVVACWLVVRASSGDWSCCFKQCSVRRAEWNNASGVAHGEITLVKVTEGVRRIRGVFRRSRWRRRVLNGYVERFCRWSTDGEEERATGDGECGVDVGGCGGWWRSTMDEEDWGCGVWLHGGYAISLKRKKKSFEWVKGCESLCGGLRFGSWRWIFGQKWERPREGCSSHFFST